MEAADLITWIVTAFAVGIALSVMFQLGKGR